MEKEQFDSIEEAFDAIRTALEAGDIEGALEAETRGRRTLNQFRAEYNETADVRQGTDDAGEAGADPSADFEKDEGEPEKEADTPEEGDSSEELKALVEKNAKEFKVPDVIEAVMRTPVMRDARESVMKPETGQMVEVQAFRLTDSKFRVLDQTTIQKIVDVTKIDEIEWTAETQDCEDICTRFVSECLALGFNSVGRVMSWSGGHCFIVFMVNINDAIQFEFFEPQTDKFIEPGAGNYCMKNCLILIS